MVIIIICWCLLISFPFYSLLLSICLIYWSRFLTLWLLLLYVNSFFYHSDCCLFLIFDQTMRPKNLSINRYNLPLTQDFQYKRLSPCITEKLKSWSNGKINNKLLNPCLLQGQSMLWTTRPTRKHITGGIHTSIAGSVVPLLTPITLETLLSGSHRLFASYAIVVGSTVWRHFWRRDRRKIFGLKWLVRMVIDDRMTHDRY